MRSSASLLVLAATLAAAAPTAAQSTLTLRLDPVRPAGAISPLVFGSNHELPGLKDASVRRWGGNATETYNWETNFNNSGHDYIHNSGTWLNRYAEKEGITGPAAAIIQWHQESIRRGVPSIINLPLMGYVAADGSGPISESEAAPSPRWKKVVYGKPGPYPATPDPADDTVSIDELVHFLVKRFGPANSPTGIRYYSLGNEPGLWASTHPRVQREKLKARDLVAKAIEAAKAIKRIDPTAQIVGPSSFGVYEYATLCEAPDWPEIKAKGGYAWFLDYYLDEFAKASRAEGRRLLDVLTVHFYMEGEINEHGGAMGILHSSRTLWDPTYKEPSWLSEILPQFLPVIPRLHASIRRYYPGTRLGFTEFERGKGSEIWGGLAMADLWGIFATQGVFLATHWPFSGFDGDQPAPFAVSARRLYTGGPGLAGQFAGQKLTVSGADQANIPSYAAVDPATGIIRVVVISRRLHAATRIEFKIAGRSYRITEAVGFDEFSPELKPIKLASPLSLEMRRRSAARITLAPAEK